MSNVNKYAAVATVALIFLLFLATVNLAYATVPNINLPPNKVSLNVEWPSSECYYYIWLSNVPPGYHVSNGRYVAWCVDEYHCIKPGRTYWAEMYSSYDPQNPHRDDDWDMVNYILNHKQGSWEDVQHAIWFFVDGGRWPKSPAAQAMVNEALEQGEGFTPGPGQILAVVLFIDDCTQIPIIEVPVPVENVVPQFPIGTALGLIAFAAAFGVFIYKGKILHI